MKNLKLVLHRCGLFFMLAVMAVLLISKASNALLSTLDLSLNIVLPIFVWGLFFGLSFIIFDFKKIPNIVSRLVHFIFNGFATCVWVYEMQTEANSRLLQLIFFALVIYVFVYWTVHFTKAGLTKLFSKFLSHFLQ